MKDSGDELPEEQAVFELLSGKTRNERKKTLARAKAARLAIARAGRSYSDSKAKRDVAARRSKAVQQANALRVPEQRRPLSKSGKVTLGDAL